MAEKPSFWRGRKVLVTGCTGFLGSAVARELFARGAEVVGLVNERPVTDIFGPHQGGRVHLVRGRADNVFRLHSAMAVHEVSAVFHLAACDPGPLLQAVGRYSRRVPVVTARPDSQLALAQSDERLSVVRFGEVFGPGDRKLFRVVPATAIALLSGESVALPADGPARGFVFVRDAARACLRAAEAGPNASAPGGWLLTDRQMVTAVRDVFAGNPTEAPDLTKALNETLAWYREFLRAGTALRAA